MVMMWIVSVQNRVAQFFGTTSVVTIFHVYTEEFKNRKVKLQIDRRKETSAVF
jgi:hypothetical protein